MKKVLKIAADRDYSDEILKITNVGAFAGSDAFLVMTKQKAALFDSGFSFCAEKMIENIKSVLGNRALDYILLTHSHYDHASGSVYCRSHFKDVKVAASAYTARVFSKPSAVALMRKMNASAARTYGFGAFEDKLNDLAVDMIVGEGSEIDLGDVSLQVMEAPGHTNCSIAFYSPQEKMLLSAETPGCVAGEHLVAPCYLVSYQKTLDFINRVLRMEIEKILIPHFGVLEGDACRNFLLNALRSNVALKDLILSAHRQGKTQKEIIENYKDVYYNNEIQKIQPLRAFELNAGFLVSMILNECQE